jgi:hypothetical protein
MVAPRGKGTRSFRRFMREGIRAFRTTSARWLVKPTRPFSRSPLFSGSRESDSVKAGSPAELGRPERGRITSRNCRPIPAGLYWRKGTAVKACESQNQQLYRLVHDAPGHRMPNAELAVAMDISRKYLETLLSHVRKRWRNPPLFEGPTGDGRTVASAKSLAVLKRDGRIVDGRGGTFFSAPEVVTRAEAVAFTTLRPKRPPVDSGKLAQEVARLKGLTSSASTWEGFHGVIAVAQSNKQTQVFWNKSQLFVQVRRRSGPYQSCRPVCSIALIQAKLKEFFDRAGATDCLFEIRLGYLRSLWSSHCEWLISASRSIL